MDAQTEVAKCRAFPPGPDFSLVFLNSFDYVRIRCKELAQELHGHPSEEHERFVAVCAQLGLPFNQSKKLLGSYVATLQGGEFDGRVGIFAHARQRGFRLAAASLVLARRPRWTADVLRH